jgi:hypothetical protein
VGYTRAGNLVPEHHHIHMSTYVPELLNELTRIVVTSMNHNPSIEEYDEQVIPRWQRCQAIQEQVESAGRVPTVEEIRKVAREVIEMLRIKRVPEPELRDRIDEAIARARAGGLYSFVEADVRSELG